MSTAPAPTAAPAPSQTPASNPTLAEVFRNPNFSKFWVAQVVSYLGDRIDQMAMLALVTAAAGISVDEQSDRASQIVFFGALPYLVISPFIGALIDRVDRRKLLVHMDIFRAAVILAVALFIRPDAHPGIVYGVVFLIGCATAVFAPTKSAYIPEIVPDNHLLRANSVSATMGSLMTLIGTPIGAWLVQGYGYQPALYVDAGTYLFSMLMLLWIVRPRARAEAIAGRKEELRHEGNYFRNLLDGLRYVVRNRVPGTSVMLDSTFFLVGGIIYVCINNIAYGRLASAQATGGGNSGEAVGALGVVFGTLGVGLFLGSVFAGRVAGGLRLGQVLAVSFWGAGAFMIVLAFTKTLLATCAAVFLLAFFAGGIVISLETALQKSVPDDRRGRVFALNSFLLNFFLLAGIQATTITVLQKHVLSIEGALTVGACVAALGGVIGLFRMPRDLSIRAMHA